MWSADGSETAARSESIARNEKPRTAKRRDSSEPQTRDMGCGGSKGDAPAPTLVVESQPEAAAASPSTDSAPAPGAVAIIHAAAGKKDQWWSDRVDEQRRSSQADAASMLEPVIPQPSPPPRASRVSRISEGGYKAKHLTTAQLKASLRERGVDIPDDATRGVLQDLLKACEESDAASGSPGQGDGDDAAAEQSEVQPIPETAVLEQTSEGRI